MLPLPVTGAGHCWGSDEGLKVLVVERNPIMDGGKMSRTL
jgi:hypothetical protein